jgi:hypothetical protein
MADTAQDMSASALKAEEPNYLCEFLDAPHPPLALALRRLKPYRVSAPSPRPANAHADVLLSFVAVSAIWGLTNPFLKRGNESTVSVAPTGRPVVDALRQVVATLLNWRFSVPFLINQSGSIVYIYLLGSHDLSMAVPIVNSLTFIFTAIGAASLGEEGLLSTRTAIGASLIVAGVATCVAAKHG